MNKLPDQIRSLFAVLLKNGLISIGEIAMFRAHHAEDKSQMLDIVKRLYENCTVHCGESEATLMTADDVFMLIDYIVDDPISTKPNTDDWGIKTVPTPYIPQNPVPVMPLTYPMTPVEPTPRQLPQVWCAHQPGNNCCFCTTASARC